jgi:hypothetical protein
VKLATVAVVVFLAGCTSSSGGSDASAECNCPSGYDGGVCVCPGYTVPVCSPTAESFSTCAVDGGSCLGCSQGAGFGCTCGTLPANVRDGGGLGWTCYGSGRACTGGT